MPSIHLYFGNQRGISIKQSQRLERNPTQNPLNDLNESLKLRSIIWIRLFLNAKRRLPTDG